MVYLKHTEVFIFDRNLAFVGLLDDLGLLYLLLRLLYHLQGLDTHRHSPVVQGMFMAHYLQVVHNCEQFSIHTVHSNHQTPSIITLSIM